MNIYYIDTENIGSRKWNYIIKQLEPGDCTAIFYSDQADSINSGTLHNLQKKKVTIKHIYTYPGKKGGNAMDFQITSMLGYGIAKLGRKAGYRIISNDNGYNPVATYWKQLGYDVEVIHPDTEMKPDIVQDSAETKPMKNKKMLKNELMQRNVPEKDARLIANMMEAASRKERRIRCVSMHSRLNEHFGKQYGDQLYNQLKNYFIKNLQS